jgi:ACS family glucarate transporter-like MFS transporter
MSIRTGGVRWSLMFCLLAPITFVMSLDRTAIAVAAPTIQHEYNFSLFEMSVILTSFSWTYALLQVPGGWLAERFGPRRMLFWANSLWSVLTAATPLGFNLTSFVGLRALLGVGQAADWPSSIVAIRRWFPLRERGKGNSILLGGLYLGPIVAAPATTWVIAAFGWRWAFYSYGALGILLGIAWWAFFRDHPVQHPSITPEEVALIGEDIDRRAPPVPPGAFARCLGEVQFWAIGVQYFFLVMIQSFYGTWLPTYLVTARHLSLKAMGIYASLPWVAMFGSVFITGAVADLILRRTQSVWATRVPLAIGGFVVSAVALMAGAEAPSVPLMLALLCLSLASVGVTQVSIWPSTQDLGRGATGLVSGWTNFWGNAAGVVGPMLMAALVKWTGSWSGAMIGIALSGVAGAVLWLFVHPQRPLAALTMLAPGERRPERT